jgi:hypothetical protein
VHHAAHRPDAAREPWHQALGILDDLHQLGLATNDRPTVVGALPGGRSAVRVGAGGRTGIL